MSLHLNWIWDTSFVFSLSLSPLHTLSLSLSTLISISSDQTQPQDLIFAKISDSDLTRLLLFISSKRGVFLAINRFKIKLLLNFYGKKVFLKKELSKRRKLLTFKLRTHLKDGSGGSAWPMTLAPSPTLLRQVVLNHQQNRVWTLIANLFKWIKK